MPRQEPERTCIVTRAVHPAAELIRFVLGPDDRVVADLQGRLPGRGVWVTARSALVDEAVKRRLFGRAFKADVVVPATLSQEIDDGLLRMLRQSLSLANKAGRVVTGFAKVEAAIATETLAALVHAADSSPDGQRKLAGALRKRLGDAISGFPVVHDLSGPELDLALGRTNVIHAALVAGAGSDGFLASWKRLRAYRGSADDRTGPPRQDGRLDDIEPAGTRAE